MKRYRCGFGGSAVPDNSLGGVILCTVGPNGWREVGRDYSRFICHVQMPLLSMPQVCACIVYRFLHGHFMGMHRIYVAFCIKNVEIDIPLMNHKLSESKTFERRSHSTLYCTRTCYASPFL